MSKTRATADHQMKIDVTGITPEDFKPGDVCAAFGFISLKHSVSFILKLPSPVKSMGVLGPSHGRVCSVSTGRT